MPRTPSFLVSLRRRALFAGSGVATAMIVAATVLSGRMAPREETIETVSKGSATTYVTRTIEGFTVHVDQRLLGEQRAVGDEALGVLASHLFQIRRVVRPEPLEKLRTIAIFLGLDDPVAPCACYHPSPDWLAENGYDRKKAKAVEIANAGNFVSWTREQPWMVLHELAHGFDDRWLTAATEQGRELDALHQAAKENGAYDRVLHWDGGEVRHYALNTSDEYFAEAVEAWFGANDFFPFVHAELVRHDEKLAEFLARVVGTPISSRAP